jgi:hypothetical protein
MISCHRRKPMLRFAALGLSILVVSGAFAQDKAGAPTAPQPVIAMEDPRPGDFWTYDVRDEISGKITAVRSNMVTEVTPTEISVRFEIKERNRGGLNVYDRTWNLKSGSAWKYQPHDGAGIQMPLKVGASWKFQNDDVNSSTGAIWKRSGQSKVVGQETVTTKAGTFETFKIETAMMQRPTNDPTHKSELTQQTWYAPTINHWVKRSFVSRADGHLRTNETYELVEYGRKQ